MKVKVNGYDMRVANPPKIDKYRKHKELALAILGGIAWVVCVIATGLVL